MPFVEDGFVADGFVSEEVAVSPFLSNRVATANRGDCLLELYLLDTNGNEEIIRVSRRGTSTKTKNVSIGNNILLANHTYLRKLLHYPEIKESAWDGNSLLSPITSPNTYTFRIKNTNGSFDHLEDYTWEGQRFVAYFVDVNNLSDGIKLCEGILSTPDFTLIEIVVYGKSKDFLFQAPINTKRFRGTSYGLELTGDKTVSFGNPSQVNTQTNMTAEGWLWLEAYATTDPRRVWGHFFSGAEGPWQIVPLSNGKVSVRCTIGTLEQSVTSDYIIPLKTPVHVAVIISGRDLTFVFFNSDTWTKTVEVKLLAFTSSTRDPANIASNYVLRSASDATFKIWFDDLRVWNYARTISQIDNYRLGPLPLPQVGLVHYAKLDEGIGTSAADSSTTGANGTISGAGTHTWIWMCEGGSELANIEKQDIWGKRFGIKPTLVDPIRYIYSVGPGPYESVEVYEGGLLIVQNADAGSQRSLVTGSVAAGTNTPFLSRGLFRLGTKPIKPISCIVEGYNNSVGGSAYIETIPELVREISISRGKIIDPAEIETDSFAVLEAIETAVVGISSFEVESEGSKGTGGGTNNGNGKVHKSIGKVIGKLLQSTGGRSGFTDNKLFVERFNGVQASPSRVIQRFLRTPTRTTPETIIYGVKVLYRRNDVVMSTSDLSQTVVGTDNWHQWTVDYLEEYSEDGDLREQYEGKGGNILTLTTCLYNPSDAKSLADRVLPLVKGKKYTWEVIVPETESDIQVGDTVALEYRLANKARTPRLKMDGTVGLWVLQKEHSRMTGSIMLRLWE